MIDIIMPCYNAEKYIEETVQSVLCQTEKEFQLICIDDCSIDNTYSILQMLSQRDHRIHLFKNETNSGIAATRNRGIKEGNAKYIAFLDDDDIMPPDRLKKGRDYLDTHQDIGVVAGNYLIFDEQEKRKVVQKEKFYSAREVRGIMPFINIIPNGTTLIRRELIDKNNISFCEEYGIEDYHFYTDLLMVTDINILPYIMLEHRVMETQYSAVCINSEKKFTKRQEAFDNIHLQLIKHIAEQCEEKDVNLYLRFTRENIGIVKANDIVRLHMSLSEIRKKVKEKGNADYHVFDQYARYVLMRAIKKFIFARTG